MTTNSQPLTVIQSVDICCAAGVIGGIAETNELLSVIGPYRALGGGWELNGHS